MSTCCDLTSSGSRTANCVDREDFADTSHYPVTQKRFPNCYMRTDGRTAEVKSVCLQPLPPGENPIAVNKYYYFFTNAAKIEDKPHSRRQLEDADSCLSSLSLLRRGRRGYDRKRKTTAVRQHYRPMYNTGKHRVVGAAVLFLLLFLAPVANITVLIVKERLFQFQSLIRPSECRIHPLEPNGHYMYHQFNIQQFYVLPTQCFCVLCGSENKQRLFHCTALTGWFL